MNFIKENKLRSRINDVNFDTWLNLKITNYSLDLNINFAQKFNPKNSFSRADKFFIFFLGLLYSLI